MKTNRNDRYFLREDFVRMLRQPGLYLSIAVSLIILLRTVVSDYVHMTEPQSFLYLMSIPWGLSDFTPFAALFCALPFSDSFCADYQTRYVHFITQRTGVRKYAFGRCVTVLAGSGLCMTAIMGGTILVCRCMAAIPDTPETAGFMQGSIWWRQDLLFIWDGWLYIGLKLIVAGLFGAVWGLAALALSTLLPNRFVTLVAPFVLYQGLWMSMITSPFNPVYLLRADAEVIPSLVFVLTVQGFMILVWGTVAYIGMCRRLRNG